MSSKSQAFFMVLHNEERLLLRLDIYVDMLTVLLRLVFNDESQIFMKLFFAPAHFFCCLIDNSYITPFFALRKSSSFAHLLTFIHSAHIHVPAFMQIPQIVIFLSLSYICRVLKFSLYMLTYSKQAWLFHFCINHRK